MFSIKYFDDQRWRLFNQSEQRSHRYLTVEKQTVGYNVRDDHIVAKCTLLILLNKDVMSGVRSASVIDRAPSRFDLSTT